MVNTSSTPAHPFNPRNRTAANAPDQRARIVRVRDGDARLVCCGHCNSVLGIATATVLHLGPVRIVRVVTLVCQRCDRHLLWKPEPEEERALQANVAPPT